MAIAAAHFDFTVKEKGIEGSFDNLFKPDIEFPKNRNTSVLGLKDQVKEC